MRDPKRIDMILKELEFYWKKNPDLRLGQIVANMAATAKASDIFYMKDEAAFCALRLSNCGIAKVGDADDIKYIVSLTGKEHEFSTQDEACAFAVKMIPILNPESLAKAFDDMEVQPKPKEE